MEIVPDGVEKGRVKFVKEISLGNIITLVGMLAPMVVWAFSTHADVQTLKAELPRIEVRQKDADSRQDTAAADNKREIKAELQEINRKLDRLIETRSDTRKERCDGTGN